MFKWEPIEKLYAQPHMIQQKIGKVMFGKRTDKGDEVFVSHWMGHRWAHNHVNPTHFMLIEPLPTE